MPSERVVQALNQLAGAASNEIIVAREAKTRQNERLQNLARAKAELDRRFGLEKGKLGLQRAELILAQQRLGLDTNIAAGNDEVRKLAARASVTKAEGDKLKAERDVFDSTSDALLGIEEQIVEGIKKGAPVEMLEGLDRQADTLSQRLYGKPLTEGTPDFAAAQQAAKGPAIDPLSAEGTDLTFKFQTLANKITKDFETVSANMGNINVATDRMLANPDSINRIATDQATIISFNKILDPTSVVRESEYERTPANTSLINRARGALIGLQQGGAKLTPEDIVENRETAKEMVELRRQITQKKLQTQVLGPAGKRGLDVSEISSGLGALPDFKEINADPPAETVTPKTFDVDGYIKSLNLRGQ